MTKTKPSDFAYNKKDETYHNLEWKGRKGMILHSKTDLKLGKMEWTTKRAFLFFCLRQDK